MVKTTQPRHRNYRRICCRLWIDPPSVRCILCQRIVNSVFVMILHVITDQSTKMCFIQRDDMIQNLAPTTAYPALRYAILPRCLHVRPLGFQARCLQEPDDLFVELRISVQNHVPVWANLWKGLPQLLHNPFCSRVSSNVEVENLAAAVLDHKEQYSNWNVNVGTVKKSKATIASR